MIKEKHKVKKSIILLGDGAVGKTSLIRRFVLDSFDDHYITTIGAKVSKKTMVIEDDTSINELSMMIWDIMGQKGYRSTQAISFGGVEGAMIVCDLTRRDSLDSIRDYWIPSLLTTTGRVPVVLLGNKEDLKDKIEFGMEELKKVTSEYGDDISIAFLSSAKTGNNVESAFLDIGRRILKSTVEPKPQLTQVRIADTNNINTLVDVADHIIADFCDQFGGIDYATPFVKKQIDQIGLDVRNPTRDKLIKLVNALAQVEKGFKEESEINLNKRKRMHLVKMLDPPE